MNKETTKEENVIDKIRTLLLNYDLALDYAKGEINYHDCNMKLYANSQKKKEKARYISHKIDKEKFEVYYDEIVKAKEDVLVILNSVLDKYIPIYKTIFIMKYFQQREIECIANQTGYSSAGIYKILNKIRKDFEDIDC